MVRTPRNVGRGGTTPVQSIARRWRRASAIGCRAIFSSRAPRSTRSVSYSSRIPGREGVPPVHVHEGRRDPDRARRVRDVHDRPVVLRLDLDRGVGPRRRRAADQQRQLEALALHLAGHVAHLLERGRDEPGQPDEVGIDLARGLEDALDRDHDPEVDDLVVVAGEHDPDDVLADVVDVALDRGHDDPAVGPGRAGLALGLDERHEVGDRLLHDPGALDHLGQEHLAGPEQVADHVHPVHQRALDDLDRAGRGLAGLLGVLDDERVEPFDERVRQPLVDRQLAPGEGVAAGPDRVGPLARRTGPRPPGGARWRRGAGPARRPRRGRAASARCRRRSRAPRR